MQKLVMFGAAAATAAVVALSGGVALADSGPGGGSGSGSGGSGQSGGGSGGPGPGGGGGGARGVWPANYPLPNPGTVTMQSPTSAVVQSPNSVQDVFLSLFDVYVNGLGCAEQDSTTKALDFLCVNPSTGLTDEVSFNFNAFPLPGPVQSITIASLIPG